MTDLKVITNHGETITLPMESLSTANRVRDNIIKAYQTGTNSTITINTGVASTTFMALQVAVVGVIP